MTMPRALLSVAPLTLTGDALTASFQVNTQSRIFFCKVEASFLRVSKLSVSVVCANCNAAMLSYSFGSLCQSATCLPALVDVNNKAAYADQSITTSL